MNILLIEPYFTGSHARWAREWKRYSRHEIEFLSLPGRLWKWRMHGGAVTLAHSFLEQSLQPDLLVCTDMLDVSLFLSLTRKETHDLPVALYMHENQLTYPWSDQDEDVLKQRDHHYAFINYSSALSADAVFFNSQYHRRSFLSALPAFLRQYPDYQNEQTVAQIEQKSDILFPGIAYNALQSGPAENTDTSPVLLWNHRWEYDKRPEAFFETIFSLDEEGLDFELIVLGSSNDHYPGVFDEARDKMAHRILHFGYAATPDQYRTWLQMGDILPVTSIQDFFGLSVVEAIACGLLPLLPDRLAYPEHLPEETHSTFLYDSDKDLLSRIRRWIETWPAPRRQRDLHLEMKKYDWEILGEKYDSAMEQLIHSSSS